METRIYPMNLLPTENGVTEMALSLQQAIPGYGFRPTEEVLINYLKSEVPGWRGSFCIIPTLDNIYKINPWYLPAKFNEKSNIPSTDQEWWFICPQTPNQRISRRTPCGFSWKITGKHKHIKARNEGEKIGSKITLVFLDGRNSKGAKSNWVMHELHPHPDDTGLVLCCLKRKQDEKAEDNQEPSIQVRGNQPNDAAITKNEDIPSIPQFQCPEVVITELSKKVYSKSDGSYQNGTKSLAPIHEDNHHFSPDQESLMWTKNSSSTANSSGSFLAVSEPTNDDLNSPHPFLNVDFCSAIEAEEEQSNQPKAEISGTSNFIGEQADESCDGLDSENPELLPSAEHRVQEIQNQLHELITNGSSSSTAISSGSRTTVTKERSRMEPWMSPRDRDSFPNHEFFDHYSLISEPEAEIGEIQYGQLGESTCWENLCAKKNCWPGSHIQQGSACKSKGDSITMPPKPSKNDKGKVMATSFEPPTKSQIQISSMTPVQTWTQILEEEPIISPELSQSPEETIMLLPHTSQKSKLKTSSQAIELSSIPTPLATSGNKLKRISSEVVISTHATPPKSRSRFFTQNAYLVN